MSRDDELCYARAGELMQDAKERQLPLRRQGGLGLIQHVETVVEPMLKQREKRFTVREGIEALA